MGPYSESRDPSFDNDDPSSPLQTPAGFPIATLTGTFLGATRPSQTPQSNSSRTRPGSTQPPKTEPDIELMPRTTTSPRRRRSWFKRTWMRTRRWYNRASWLTWINFGLVVFLCAMLSGFAYIMWLLFIVIFLSPSANKVTMLPAEVFLMDVPKAENVRWEAWTGRKVGGQSEELLAMATLELDLFEIPKGHGLWREERFQDSILGRPDPARYLRCELLGDTHTGAGAFRRQKLQGEEYVLYWKEMVGAAVRNCYLMTEKMLKVQKTVGGAALRGVQLGRSDRQY